MSEQNRIDEFLSKETSLIKETIGIFFKLVPAQPSATDKKGRPYVNYSYGIVHNPINSSMRSTTKLLHNKVIEKLREISNDTPTLNGNEYVNISFRQYPTFTIDNDRLQVTFRCLSYVNVRGK